MSTITRRISVLLLIVLTWGFVLSRLTCTYAHRMQIMKGHAPIQNVLQAAGIT